MTSDPPVRPPDHPWRWPRVPHPRLAPGRTVRASLRALGGTALVAAASVASLGASWLRWINPFVDSGREMNVPARLAAGERLYRDVVFYYGPAGPWLQAWALRLWDAGRRLQHGAATSAGAASAAGRPRPPLPPVAALLAGRARLGPAPAAALAAGRSWLPLEIACLALAAAILYLLYRLAAAAGGPGSALAATALAAAFCLGAPRGGAFIFPYSASSLYALAGGLLALAASLRPPGWQRRLLVAGGLALALTARAEIGALVTLVLLIAALRSRPDPPHGAARPRGFPPAGARAAVADLVPGVALAAAVYGVAFAGTPWHVLLTEGPFTHALAMPPEWKHLYAAVSGFARLDRSLPLLALGLALDALLLLICAWPAGGARRMTGRDASPAGSGGPAGVPGSGTPPAVPGGPPRIPAAGNLGPGEVATGERAAAAGGHRARPRLLPRLAFCAAVAAGVAFTLWAGTMGWRWARFAASLPPVLLPLPLVAAAAALAALRRPLDDRGRARFLLFGLAAGLGTRVLLGLDVGPAMTAYCALPLPPLLAAAAVLAADVLAPRLRDPAGCRFRLLALAGGLAALHLARVGALAWGPHVVRVDTPGGSLRLPWKEATAVAGTLDDLAARARPGDRLASFPEAGFFNFVLGLPNPLRQEEVFPGVLGGGREAEAVARLLAARPRFVLLANRPTPEFGQRAFGDDYAAGLWSAVEDRYSLAAAFGNAAPDARVGAGRFFIRVYERTP